MSVCYAGLLHAARQTSRGFITVDYSVNDNVLKHGKHPHDATLVIDIVYSGIYPAGTVDAMMRYGLSLKALVEAGGPLILNSTDTGSDSQCDDCSATPCLRHGRGSDSELEPADYAPDATLITSLTSPPDNVCFDAGTFYILLVVHALLHEFRSDCVPTRHAAVFAHLRRVCAQIGGFCCSVPCTSGGSRGRLPCARASISTAYHGACGQV